MASDQSGSGVLKGMIDKLLKPDEILLLYILNAKEKLVSMYSE